MRVPPISRCSMAVTSPTPWAGCTALSPTLKSGAGEGGGTWIAMPGGGPGRFDRRMRAGGAGGGSVDRTGRWGSCAGAGTFAAVLAGSRTSAGTAAAGTGGGSGAGTDDGGRGSARAGAFTERLPFVLSPDFAVEADATGPRVEGDTARRAEPLRGGALRGRSERTGVANTFATRRHPARPGKPVTSHVVALPRPAARGPRRFCSAVE